MSFFNEANELASRLVWGCSYQDSAVICPLDEVALVRGGDRIVVPAPEQSERAWAETATLLEAMMRDGWRVV